MAVTLGATFTRLEPIGPSGLTFERVSGDASYIGFDGDGDPIPAVWDPTFTEIGSTGTYLVTYVTEDLDWHFWAGISSAGHPVAVQFEVITAAQADPAGALASQAVGGASGTWGAAIGVLLRSTLPRVTLTGPVVAGGDVRIVRGDDYLAADNRALSWSSDDWADLTGATVTLTVYGRSEEVALTKAVTVVEPTGTAVVRVDLTAEETADLPRGGLRLVISAVLAGIGSDATLVAANMSVNDVP